MEDFEKILEVKHPRYISQLRISRERDQGIATITIEISNNETMEILKLFGLNDFDSIPSMLDAERVLISKEIGSQRQFGTIRVECFDDDSYCEYWCDRAEREQT